MPTITNTTTTDIFVASLHTTLAGGETRQVTDEEAATIPPTGIITVTPDPAPAA